jgi:hypothetical protein
MSQPRQYLSEFVCGTCARTGHVTWEGEGSARRIVEQTESIRYSAGDKTRFACAHCGTPLEAV